MAIELGSNLYVPVHDHSGHVVALLSHATGEVVQNYSYTAFGEEPRHRQVWLWGLHGTDPSSANPWRFASKRHDPETGWIHLEDAIMMRRQRVGRRVIPEGMMTALISTPMCTIAH